MTKGFTCGAFDLLHAGHVLMLEEAKTQCDYLVVGLQTDPSIDRPEKHHPVQSVFERFFQLKACRYVDEIIPYETEEDLYNLLCAIKPDLRIVGEDYRDQHFTGRELPIQVYFNSRKHPYSSSELRKRL
jgi:glycerol-3-phosphate cytidylyltransferase